jgi:Lactonase, 7-bladed beta-propeller
MRKISRRNFIQSSAATALAAQPLFASAKAMDTRKLLLAGTQTAGTSKGIYAYAFDTATGELTQTGLAAEAENPTFLALAPNGKTLIAANELDHIGAVSSFTIDPPPNSPRSTRSQPKAEEPVTSPSTTPVAPPSQPTTAEAAPSPSNSAPPASSAPRSPSSSTPAKAPNPSRTQRTPTASPYRPTTASSSSTTSVST